MEAAAEAHLMLAKVARSEGDFNREMTHLVDAVVLGETEWTAQAHLRLAITYEQGDATAMKHENSSFDLITGFLLAHEVTAEVLEQILGEAYRVLRPGGHIRFLDLPPFSALAPEVAFLQSFDNDGNGEKFWNDFLASDFKATLRRAGFVNVADGPLDYDEPTYSGTAALMRTGEFRVENRWVTEGDKPGGPHDG